MRTLQITDAEVQALADTLEDVFYAGRFQETDRDDSEDWRRVALHVLGKDIVSPVWTEEMIAQAKTAAEGYCDIFGDASAQPREEETAQGTRLPAVELVSPKLAKLLTSVSEADHPGLRDDTGWFSNVECLLLEVVCELQRALNLATGNDPWNRAQQVAPAQPTDIPVGTPIEYTTIMGKREPARIVAQPEYARDGYVKAVTNEGFPVWLNLEYLGKKWWVKSADTAQTSSEPAKCPQCEGSREVFNGKQVNGCEVGDPCPACAKPISEPAGEVEATLEVRKLFDKMLTTLKEPAVDDILSAEEDDIRRAIARATEADKATIAELRAEVGRLSDVVIERNCDAKEAEIDFEELKMHFEQLRQQHEADVARVRELERQRDDAVDTMKAVTKEVAKERDAARTELAQSKVTIERLLSERRAYKALPKAIASLKRHDFDYVDEHGDDVRDEFIRADEALSAFRAELETMRCHLRRIAEAAGANQSNITPEESVERVVAKLGELENFKSMAEHSMQSLAEQVGAFTIQVAKRSSTTVVDSHAAAILMIDTARAELERVKADVAVTVETTAKVASDAVDRLTKDQELVKAKLDRRTEMLSALVSTGYDLWTDNDVREHFADIRKELATDHEQPVAPARPGDENHCTCGVPLGGERACRTCGGRLCERCCASAKAEQPEAADGTAKLCDKDQRQSDVRRVERAALAGTANRKRRRAE